MATARLKSILKTICAGLGCRRVELSLLCCDDDAMQALNARWRGKDKTTDVLSFPQLAARAFDAPPDGEHWGDLVVSMPQAARQAARYDASLEQEMRRLLVHGVLHLLGHDHVHGGRQAGRMRREEARLLQLLDETLGTALA